MEFDRFVISLGITMIICTAIYGLIMDLYSTFRSSNDSKNERG